jgi:hypothetical protein
MRIDAPEVLAEVRAEFERSESALITNDREALVEFFLDAPTTVRYGIDDAQYGHEELAAFRRSQAVATAPRDLRRTVFTTFGRDLPSRTPSSCPTVPTRSAASHRPGCAPTGVGRSSARTCRGSAVARLRDARERLLHLTLCSRKS